MGFTVITTSSGSLTIPSSLTTVNSNLRSVCSFTSGAVKVGFDDVESRKVTSGPAV